MITNEHAGKTFCRLFLNYEAPQRGYSRYYNCTCSCGVTKEVRLSHIMSKKILSCGCLKYERITVERTGVTGRVTDTRLYRILSAMRQRCENVNNTNYSYYGGRGISVCPEWARFGVFMEWALSNGYSEKLTINRIDNSKGYSPDNCEWVSLEDNISEMCDRHLLAGTGAFSADVVTKITAKNRDKFGSKFSMYLGANLVSDFTCLLDAANYICEIKSLETDPKQIKKNISACLHRKRKTCHGFTFKSIVKY